MPRLARKYTGDRMVMPNPKSGELLELGRTHHNPDPDNPLNAVVEAAANTLSPAVPLYEASSEGGDPKPTAPSSTPTKTTK
jgi:hypothetical protein